MADPTLDRSTIDALRAQAVAEIDAAATSEDLEQLRTAYLGRKRGAVTELLRALPLLAPPDRRAMGQAANELKQTIEGLLADRASALTHQSGRTSAWDPTMPGKRVWRGGLHPVTQIIDEICDIFRLMGFTRVVGPEAETDHYNFTALNTPLDHPAADAQDTFFLAPGLVLRSHTSPVQARTMEAFAPPIRVVVPGRAYRRDPFDASHAPVFDQIEGLAVDEGISMVDLKHAISVFARELFGPTTRVRFRPSFFPFTEPSAEVDVSCTICGGDGCSACKQTGWMEIMGSGMVHPHVLEHAGIDADRYTGWAFGMGPARIAMLRYGVPDIRMFYDGDMRFLELFGEDRP